MSLYTYDRELMLAVGRIANEQPLSMNTADQRSLAATLLTPLEQLELVSMDLGRKVEDWQLAYYLLMEYRKYEPDYFPVHDLSLLLANIISSHNKPGNLVLLDMHLLPSACLLAGAGWKILVHEEADSGKVAQTFQKALPCSRWSAIKNDLPAGSHILGSDPGTLVDLIPDIFNWFAPAASGVFLGSWEFLGINRYDYARRIWLENGRLSFVYQLPRPRRQGTAKHPAIIGFRDGNAPLRLARIASCVHGPGALDQSAALKLLVNPPATGASINLDRTLPGRNGTWNLTPALWLNECNIKSVQSKVPIRSCAQIIRCQLPRKKIQHYPPESFRIDAANGVSMVREVGLTDFDPVSGFLLGQGENVGIEFKRTSSRQKYLLQEGDIIFPFKGTTGSLGKCGFVFENPASPTIAGPAFVVIRALAGVNPAWLFWYLRRSDGRSAILARATGSSMLTINIEEIRDLRISRPDQSGLENLLQKHERIKKEMAAIMAAREKMHKEVHAIMETSAPARREFGL